MEKRYTIEAKVPVYNQKTDYVTRAVKARNVEEAKKLCKKQLESEGYEVNEIRKKYPAIPAMISFGIVIFLSFFKYFDNFNSLSIFPDAKAVLFAVLLYSSFVVRVKGIKNTFKSALDTILSIEVVTVIAICIQIIVGTGEDIANPILNFFNSIRIAISNIYTLIFLAILISWLGIKPVAGIIWILVLLSGFGEFVLAGKYMGNLLSYLFIIAAFVGFVMYLKYEGPTILNSFKKAVTKASGHIKSDLDSTQKLANQLVDRYVPGVLTGKAENKAVSSKETETEGDSNE